jgi:hypothetical protein
MGLRALVGEVPLAAVTSWTSARRSSPFQATVWVTVGPSYVILSRSAAARSTVLTCTNL